MKRKIPKRILTAVLSLALLLTLLPTASMAVRAADGDSESGSGATTSSGIELSKTATLEDDGTYTINLEAYATGTTTTTTTTSGVPLDIVLVIDQSGSMENSITSTTSYTAKDSANYSYSSFSRNTYYYYDGENYYKLSQGSYNTSFVFGTTYYYVYYTDSNGTVHYLSGTGTTTDRPTNITNSSSNSTIYTGVLYTATTTSVTKLKALQTAVTSFVNAISANAATTGADHRIAIAGFACGDNEDMSGYQSGSWNWLNTGLFINGSLTNYATKGSSATSSSLTTKNYQDALVSVNDENGKVASSITTAISNFQAEGATFISYGMEMANNVFANNSATYTKDDGTEGTRQRIVVVFTDGAPGYSGYTNAEAGAAVNYSYTAKNTYSATVYTVGLYASSDETDNVKAFMNYLSSNYPSAQYSNSNWSAGTQASSKYYMTTNDATELNNIFTTISSEATSSSTTVTLDASSVMKDIMGDGFTLTDDSTVTIKTVAGTSDGTTVTWGDVTTNSASYTISEDKTTVSVKGFDYADKYISSAHAGEKICVKITGVLPKENVTTGTAVNTNSNTSGIYANAEAESAAAYFPVPQTILTKKAYVLDYAKTASLTDLDQTSVTNIVNSFQKVSDSTNTTLTQSYGKSILSGTSVSYTPITTNWNGYDSFYVFGQTTNETVKTYATNTAVREDNTANLWSKVSVIPANNVYYEDDFVTSTDNGTVGIVYSGTTDTSDWTNVGTTSGNTETANGSTYGWETTLSDDKGDSDGSSHMSSTDGATATFTFTGTGVDIYSRTDMTTGTVYAKLTGTTNSGTSVTKRLIVDDLAESAGKDGTYYQIPTVSFGFGEDDKLAYGTYTVTLTVTNQADDDNRCTYYLDGIRVYNPLGTVTDDGSDAGDAYKADNELSAVFTEVRDILIDDVSGFSADSTVNGAVFIDEMNGTTSITTGTLANYKTSGPKNEVYLDKDQAIVFQVETTKGNTYYLGLKSADGKGTSVEFTNSNSKSPVTISHSTDLYYEITPDSYGYIVVKNTGDNLLSITKLRTTNAVMENDGIVKNSSVDGLVSYANSFSLLSTVDYTDDAMTEEEMDTNTDADTETDVDIENGDNYENLDEDDIVIDNPAEDADDTSEETDNNKQQFDFSSLFNSIRNWFNGRR